MVASRLRFTYIPHCRTKEFRVSMNPRQSPESPLNQDPSVLRLATTILERVPQVVGTDGGVHVSLLRDSEEVTQSVPVSLTSRKFPVGHYRHVVAQPPPQP